MQDNHCLVNLSQPICIRISERLSKLEPRKAADVPQGDLRIAISPLTLDWDTRRTAITNKAIVMTREIQKTLHRLPEDL